MIDRGLYITPNEMSTQQLDEWNALMQDDWLRQKLDRARRFREHIEYLNKFFPEFTECEPGFVVDLGCGAGELLEIARYYGHDIHGIEATSGKGGMGDNYLEACRIRWRQQDIKVSSIGAPYVFRNPPDWLPPRHSCVLINSRGSLEQMFCQHMDGEPHDEHHRADRMTWRISGYLRNDIIRMFLCVYDLIREDGRFVIHANGATNADEMDILLDNVACWVGFTRVHYAPRERVWVL